MQKAPVHYHQINTIFSMMKVTTTQLLKVICLLSSFVTSIIWIAFFVQFFNTSEFSKIDYLLQNPSIIVYPLFCIYSIIIVIKTNSNQGILLFSLFLSFLSQNIAIQYLFIQHPNYEREIITTISFIITSIFYIKSYQNFPQQISSEDIDAQFPKSKRLRVYLNACLKKEFLFVFPVIVYIITLIFPHNTLMQAIVLSVVLLTGILFLYVNYKVSTQSSRNKITWLLWGVLCYTFLTILYSVFANSTPGNQESITIVFMVLRTLSLFISITMCLFFFDTFDTGVLIRRTIVDGLIFILIIFLYNTIEHYFLHWITHKLHISDTLISSILSGFFVLIFSPIHHKFMHVLDGVFKRKEGGKGK